MNERFQAIDGLEDGDEKLAGWAALAGDLDDPLEAAQAKAREITCARALERQQHSVVAGTELLGLLPRVPRPLTADRELIRGLVGASMAAMDLPEVPLAAVDELIAATGGTLRDMRCEPFYAWTLEARRHGIGGDAERVRACIERIVPNLSRSNHIVELWECPGCVLVQLALCLEEWTAEGLEELFEPILRTDGSIPWREDPRLAQLVRRVYGSDACCTRSPSRARLLIAIAWARRGDRVRATAAWAGARGHRDGVWGEIARVEIARLQGDPQELTAALAEILDRLPTHEDAYEAVELGLVVARALPATDPARAAVVARLRADADRLDARIERPRHRARVEAAIG